MGVIDQSALRCNLTPRTNCDVHKHTHTHLNAPPAKQDRRKVRLSYISCFISRFSFNCKENKHGKLQLTQNKAWEKKKICLVICCGIKSTSTRQIKDLENLFFSKHLHQLKLIKCFFSYSRACEHSLNFVLNSSCVYILNLLGYSHYNTINDHFSLYSVGAHTLYWIAEISLVAQHKAPHGSRMSPEFTQLGSYGVRLHKVIDNWINHWGRARFQGLRSFFGKLLTLSAQINLVFFF